MEVNKELLERAIVEGVKNTYNMGGSTYLLLAAENNTSKEGFHFGCNTSSAWIVVSTVAEYKEALAKSKATVCPDDIELRQKLERLLTYLEVEIESPSTAVDDYSYNEGFNDALLAVVGKIKYVLEGRV